MNCPNCHLEIEPGWKVCPSCAMMLLEIRMCPKCNEALHANWKACPFCSTDLNKPSASINLQDSVVREIHQNKRQTDGASIGGNIVINISGNFPKRSPTSGIAPRKRAPGTMKSHVGLWLSDHKWHDVPYDHLKVWVKNRKDNLNSGEIIRGKAFRYRRNLKTGKYQVRLRQSIKKAFYSP